MEQDKHSDRRRREILDTGLKAWASDPTNVTVRYIARQMGVTHGTVMYHFVSIVELRNAIAEHAVKVGESRVIAQLIATRHPAIADMNEKTRRNHMNAAGRA